MRMAVQAACQRTETCRVVSVYCVRHCVSSAGAAFLRWFSYYAHRIADGEHWGKNLSGLKFDQDGGFYIEALRDLKYVAGNAAMQFLRGPMFSNMVKTGAIGRGHFDMSTLDETQLRERIFFGGAIPSVQALNGRPKPEDTVTRGGMHGPLAKMVSGLSEAYHVRLRELTGMDLPKVSAGELKRKLEHVSAFDERKAARALCGGEERVARLVFPKEPKAGWGEARPWWVADEAAVPGGEATIPAGTGEAGS